MEEDSDITSAVQGCVIMCRTKGVRAASMVYAPMIIRLARAIVLDAPGLAEGSKQTAAYEKYQNYIAQDRDGFAELFEKQLRELIEEASIPRDEQATPPQPAPVAPTSVGASAGTHERTRRKRATPPKPKQEF